MSGPPSPLPYVIDNQHRVLAEVLNEVLGRHRGRSLDVASAYFTVDGFDLLREGLRELGSFRLLLGAEPHSGAEVGLRPRQRTRRLLTRDLDELPFTEERLRQVEELIAFLAREEVEVRVYRHGFLHAKCWLFYGDRPPVGAADRFRPLMAVVGSSNFTRPGLTSNRELNLVHKVLLEPEEVRDEEAERAVAWLGRRPSPDTPGEERRATKSEVGARAMIELEAWYEEHWAEGDDFKADLVELLDASKFGEKEYTPYQVYLKALYAYFAEDLEQGSLPEATSSAVELTTFQDDAVRKARTLLRRHHGVLVADSVGLGKTWIGKKLLEDTAYHQRMKAVVICPATLRANWQRELAEAAIAARVVSQEEMGRDEFDSSELADADVVLVDESHNFRNPNTSRYAALERILAGCGRRGRAGERKKVILLTATPINNDLLDLYHQLSLITIGDRAHFLGAGIGDLYRYFLAARRQPQRGSAALFNLLEEVVIRRTRPFIRRAYPEATLNGEPIRFPTRRLRTVHYDLEATYEGIYDEVVTGVENLTLAPYNLESYRLAGEDRDDFELGREQALVGIFKSRYLKRFESSIAAFRISVHRALEFLSTFAAYVEAGRVLRSTDFHRALRYLDRESADEETAPASLADDLDASREARRVLADMEEIDPDSYDLPALRAAIENDVEILTGLWDRVRPIGPEEDAKLERLRSLLQGELRGKKVLIFSYYRDTVRYLYRQLGHPESEAAHAFREEIGGATVRRMDSGDAPRERQRLVQRFSPLSNGRPGLAGTEQEVDVLISTDVLSEGHNLQDCGYLINYDLHWNPTRLVQRAGRIDRIGSRFDTLWLYNMFPDAGLERLLGLVQRLSLKISYIDRAGFHDASILGEAFTAQNFNTLRRIREEDDSIIEEEEEAMELVGSDALAQQLREFLESRGREALDDLPDGIHSGLARSGARGVFFYFQAGSGEETRHFWRYVDLVEETVVDNRQLIAGWIACEPETPRVIDPLLREQVFDLQERAVSDILESVRAQAARQEAPRTLDPVQQSARTALQATLNHPAVSRARAIEAIRGLAQPMVRADLRELREALRAYQSSGDVAAFLEAVESLGGDSGTADAEVGSTTSDLEREDLRLICFDLVTGG